MLVDLEMGLNEKEVIENKKFCQKRYSTAMNYK
jgi:hypothetical protein